MTFIDPIYAWFSMIFLFLSLVALVLNVGFQVVDLKTRKCFKLRDKYSACTVNTEKSVVPLKTR